MKYLEILVKNLEDLSKYWGIDFIGLLQPRYGLCFGFVYMWAQALFLHEEKISTRD